MESFYLDIGPMIRRLQQDPSEFEIRRNCIRHRPSRHRLIFERLASGRIAARCNCVEFPISREQGVALRVAIESWEERCSRSVSAADPVERLANCVNSALARCFGPGTRWRQALDAAWAWVVVTVAARSRPRSKPRLRIVSARPEDGGRAADASGETAIRSDQKAAALRQVAGARQSSLPTTSARRERRL